MPDNQDGTHWILAELFREPEGGRVSHLFALFSLLWVIYGVSTFSLPIILASPVAFLFPVAELLPRERSRLAGGLRIIGLLYALAVTVLYFIFL